MRGEYKYISANLVTIVERFKKTIREEFLWLTPFSEESVGAKKYFSNLNTLFFERIEIGSLMGIVNEWVKFFEDEIELLQSQFSDPQYDCLYEDASFIIAEFKRNLIENFSSMQNILAHFSSGAQKIFSESKENKLAGSIDYQKECLIKIDRLYQSTYQKLAVYSKDEILNLLFLKYTQKVAQLGNRYQILIREKIEFLTQKEKLNNFLSRQIILFKNNSSFLITEIKKDNLRTFFNALDGVNIYEKNLSNFVDEIYRIYGKYGVEEMVSGFVDNVYLLVYQYHRSILEKIVVYYKESSIKILGEKSDDLRKHSLLLEYDFYQKFLRKLQFCVYTVIFRKMQNSIDSLMIEFQRQSHKSGRLSFLSSINKDDSKPVVVSPKNLKK